MTDAIDTVTIPKTEYEEMKKAIMKLDCLEAAGVDNWEWYGDAMAKYREEIGEDD